MNWIVCYSIGNLFSFLLMGIDKRKAEKKKYRISENTLLTSAFFFPIGSLCGMRFFHHKTKKMKFTLFIPLFMILHIVVFIKMIY